MMRPGSYPRCVRHMGDCPIILDNENLSHEINACKLDHDILMMLVNKVEEQEHKIERLERNDQRLERMLLAVSA